MTPEQARRELTKEIEIRLRVHPVSSVWLAAAIEALIDAKLPQCIHGNLALACRLEECGKRLHAQER